MFVDQQAVMSFLPAENADVTLAAALDFIDSFDCPSAGAGVADLPVVSRDEGQEEPATDEASNTFLADNTSGSDGSPRQSTDDSPCHSPPVAGSTGEEVKRQRKKSTALASKRLRQKKKREMTALLEQVAELEARLARLQQRATIAASAGSRERHSISAAVADAAAAARINSQSSQTWLDAVVIEAQARQKAETLNLELRRALEDQVRLAQALRTLVDGRSAAQVPCLPLLLFRIDIICLNIACIVSTTVASVCAQQIQPELSESASWLTRGRPDYRAPGANRQPVPAY